MIPRVFIFGAGRAGRALAVALGEGGVDVVGLHGRRRTPADERSELGEKLSVGPLPASIAGADVVLITVRDSQLDSSLRELADATLKEGAVVLHASGSADPPRLAELRSRGHPTGTFHPLVPLTDASNGARRLRGAWIGVDGDGAARAAAEELATRLRAHVTWIPAGEKAVYHAAAVFASNFPCVLAFLARELLSGAGVPAEDASAAVISLMHASVENLRGRDPADALTGPVVRGDADTIRAHVEALRAHEDSLRVYTALTRVALEMARRTETGGGLRSEMERAIAI